MSDDDRAVMERLAALEAEVKADAEAKQQRKEAAMAKLREQRAREQADKDALRERQAALVTTTRKRDPAPPTDDEFEEPRRRGDLGDALALATRAQGVKQELTQARKQGDKSWVKSALASTLLGPIGWLYAGSWREAVPASVAWVAVAALVSKVLPMVLLFPVLLVALPLSGIAGLVYALQYNRTGSRQRLFGDDKPKPEVKALRGGDR